MEKLPVHHKQLSKTDAPIRPVTDEALKFKKPYQTVNKPYTADHNIHEEYVRDPPDNLHLTYGVPEHKSGELKTVKIRTEKKKEGVLGDEPIGRVNQETMLSSMAQEDSVYPEETAPETES